MATLTYAELKTNVASLVSASNLASMTLTGSRNNTVGLIDKIGAIVQLDTMYQLDKLDFMDDFYLEYGKSIEEWNADLILPTSFDASGSSALAPHDGTYRPATYSYSVGAQTIAQTIRDNDFNRAVHNADQLAEIIAIKVKRLTDSMYVYRYGVKREMIGKYIGKVEAAQTNAGSNAYATSTAYSAGTFVYSSGVYGVVFKPIAASNTQTWAQLVADGTIIILTKMIKTFAKPVDTATGEAFIEAIKVAVEEAVDENSGNSLNGNQLGATEGLVLIMLQGIKPNLEVQTLAGAFHEDKLALPVDIRVVPDFGSYSGNVYAILMDKRTLRLHNTFRQVDDQRNAQGAFTNIFSHTEDTAFASRNTFVRVFKSAQEELLL